MHALALSLLFFVAPTAAADPLAEKRIAPGVGAGLGAVAGVFVFQAQDKALLRLLQLQPECETAAICLWQEVMLGVMWGSTIGATIGVLAAEIRVGRPLALVWATPLAFVTCALLSSAGFLASELGLHLSIGAWDALRGPAQDGLIGVARSMIIVIAFLVGPLVLVSAPLVSIIGAAAGGALVVDLAAEE